MADVQRPVAGAGLPVLMALAAGCGAPISNGVFLEEAKFLGALPTQERFGAPTQVLYAPAGDAPVLAAAKVRATDWDDWFGVLAAAGDGLREAPPDVATAVKRRWDGVEAAHRLLGGSMGQDPGVVSFWVQAEVVRPGEGDVSWTMSLADDEDGPWTGVASGTHREREDGTGSGDLSFDLNAIAAVLGGHPDDPLGVFYVQYDDADPEFAGARSVEAAQTLVPGAVLTHGVVGETIFVFTGALTVTDDGATRLGYAAVLHDERGGWGEGVVQSDVEEETLAWTSCWTSFGGLVWQGGDPGIATAGTDASACPVPDPF
ncbi:MAG: hypothetical protein R3F59_38740 [Myxococcota bacterium]